MEEEKTDGGRKLEVEKGETRKGGERGLEKQKEGERKREKEGNET